MSDVNKYAYFNDKIYLNDKGNVNPSRVLERYLKNNYPELRNDVLNFGIINDLKFDKFPILLWHFMNNEKDYIKCDNDNCNNRVKWINFNRGYSLNCSSKCLHNSSKFKDKVKRTVNDKYGVDNVSQSKIIKDKVKNTCLERYGNESPAKLDYFKNKSKETCLEKYGVENPFNIEEVRYKALKSLKDRRIDDHKEILKNYNIKEEHIIDYKDKDNITICCENCKLNYTKPLYFITQRRKNNIDSCIHCTPIKYFSHKEKEFLEYIQNVYKGEIITNTRKIISPKELDIYLPELNLAFEYNGLYWHSELHKPKKYHLNKTNECLEKGVQLIHIYEDDWIYKNDIVKSRINNLLKISKRVYARKCVIKNVSAKESTNFLTNNHIQGNVNGKIKIGLYYNNELISLMTFGSLRKNLGQKSKEGNYELLRFCNKLNYTIVGGASRLFKQFLREYKPKNVISYADRSWSKGGLYEQLGFEYVKSTGINYFYIVNGVRRNRFNYRKDILVSQGYDSELTEHMIMLNRDIFRIYDSGSMKFIYSTST